jgi:uncharacterized MAPEG superfamily protein
MVLAKHIAAVLIAACLVSVCAGAAPLSGAGKDTAEPRGRAYLFRGLIAVIDRAWTNWRSASNASASRRILVPI